MTNGGRGLENERGALDVSDWAPILLARMIGYRDGRFAYPISAQPLSR